MTETANLGLPLVAAAQAQKHVTVNEAFQRIDALTGLAVTSVGSVAPPPSPAEGSVHIVGTGASGAWSGSDGLLALFANGGWDFIVPRTGWQGWSIPGGHMLTFDGTDWVPGLGALGAFGAALEFGIIGLDHAVGAGASSTVSGALPPGVLVIGVSARVLSAVGGAVSLDIGVAGDLERYGAGIATGVGSTGADIRSSAIAYPSGEDLILTANGGSFDGSGMVRLALHTIGMRAPRA